MLLKTTSLATRLDNYSYIFVENMIKVRLVCLIFCLSNLIHYNSGLIKDFSGRLISFTAAFFHHKTLVWKTTRLCFIEEKSQNVEKEGGQCVFDLRLPSYFVIKILENIISFLKFDCNCWVWLSTFQFLHNKQIRCFLSRDFIAFKSYFRSLFSFRVRYLLLFISFVISTP